MGVVLRGSWRTASTISDLADGTAGVTVLFGKIFFFVSDAFVGVGFTFPFAVTAFVTGAALATVFVAEGLAAAADTWFFLGSGLVATAFGGAAFTGIGLVTAFLAGAGAGFAAAFFGAGLAGAAFFGAGAAFLAGTAFLTGWAGALFLAGTAAFLTAGLATAFFAGAGAAFFVATVFFAGAAFFTGAAFFAVLEAVVFFVAMIMSF